MNVDGAVSNEYASGQRVYLNVKDGLVEWTNALGSQLDVTGSIPLLENSPIMVAQATFSTLKMIMGVFQILADNF